MALTPGVQISKGIQPTDPVPVDSWSGPYEAATEALAKTAANTSIPSAVRFKSMEVRLIINGTAKKYWYRDGITDGNLIEFSSASNAESGAASGGVGVISKTYAELKTLKDASQLVAGQYYKITDFQTKWRNQVMYTSPASINLTSAVIEPLNILAISENKFSVIAYSNLYPQDIIYYNFEATINEGMLYAAGIPNFKGWITRRIDTSKNIDIPLDWRHITVNCCRPNLSSISEWSLTETYNLWGVVKINNKLYYSIRNNNINNNPIANPTYVNTPSIYWRPITGFNEGLTYFPTDETYGLYALKPDGSYLINLPADLSTRIQKYMFGLNAESGNTENVLDSYANISIQGTGCFSNIFCGGGGSLIFGSNFQFNLLDYMVANTAGSYFYKNILAYNSSGNKFGDDFSHNRSTRDASGSSFTFTGNVFIANTSHNIFLGGTAYNIFDINTTYNHFGNVFRNNKAGSNFYSNFFPHHQTINNIFAAQFYSNFIDSNSSFYGNVTLGQCNRNNFASGGIGVNLLGENFTRNNIGTAFYNNKIGSTFTTNNIGDNFSGNTIGNYTTYNTIGANFFANSIGTGFSNNTIGSNFNQNNIEDGFDFAIVGNNFTLNNVKRSILTNFNLTASTHVYNSYDKTIFLNSVGARRLSYYNSNDQLVITDPTS
jgi:hypothetical protein